MKFGDIFKNKFMENFTTIEFSAKSIFLCLMFSAIFAVYIFFIYRKITKKTFYSKTFNISLVALTIIISAIIITIQSNIVISLGMVGALSIVRFRTAIKDPMDLTFLFWAISVGIICGANLPQIALMESVILTILILGLNYIPTVRAPMLLVINTSNSNKENEILNQVKKFTNYYKVKSKNITKNSEEMIIELRIKQEDEIVKEISNIEGVNSVSLLSHDGETTV